MKKEGIVVYWYSFSNPCDEEEGLFKEEKEEEEGLFKARRRTEWGRLIQHS